jgi:hypothetical protein
MKINYELLGFIGIIIFIGVILVFLITKTEKSYKYRIVDARGNIFTTNEVEYFNQCIEFKTNKKNELTRICGSYTIKENENFKQQ